MTNPTKPGPRAITKQDQVIGHNIKTCRILSGIQGPAIAKQLDIRTAQYYKLETGENHTTLSRASRIADTFNVSVDDLINEEKEFSKKDLKLIKPLIINFLKIDNMQHRCDVWGLIIEYLDEDVQEKFKFDSSNIDNTKLLSSAFVQIKSSAHQIRIMTFIYDIIKIK